MNFWPDMTGASAFVFLFALPHIAHAVKSVLAPCIFLVIGGRGITRTLYLVRALVAVAMALRDFGLAFGTRAARARSATGQGGRGYRGVRVPLSYLEYCAYGFLAALDKSLL